MKESMQKFHLTKQYTIYLATCAGQMTKSLHLSVFALAMAVFGVGEISGQTIRNVSQELLACSIESNVINIM